MKIAIPHEKSHLLFPRKPFNLSQQKGGGVHTIF